jgi:ribosomal protein S18 acetylase RimI-like enzyme
MLDKSIPYYNILMERKKGKPLFRYELPEGFRFVLFRPGDEKAWAEIETSVLEFDKEDDALYYFRESYMTYMDELLKRCLFIEDAEGKKVATLTVWWTYTGNRRDPWIHWVAVRPEYQGLGLGKALVSKGMKHLVEMEGDRNVYLHTQTWSYRAIGIYRKAGFEITKKKGLGGYKNNEYEEAVKLLSQLGHWGGSV